MFLSITNKLQRYTIYFIDAVFTVFELLMMGGEAAWNM